MEANPYPKTIELANNEHYIWEDGRKAGIKEVVEILRKIGWKRAANDVLIYLGKPNSKAGDMKEWGSE